MCALASIVLTSALLGSNAEQDAPARVPLTTAYVETRFVQPSTRAEDRVPRVEVRKVPRTTGEAGGTDVQVLLKPTGFDESGEACWTTSIERSTKPFRDVLVSWNVATPESTGFCVELRVMEHEKGAWSSWMYVGDWGTVPELTRQTVVDGGRIDTDYFHGERTFVRAQVRVRAFARGAQPAAAPAVELCVQRLTLCFSNPDLQVPQARDDPAPQTDAQHNPMPPAWKACLRVPFRSQKSEKAEIAGRICSPTSLAMVLAYRGIDRTTLDVAARAYDATHDIYGNWPRNIQAAFSFGVPGYLTRFTNWPDVHAMIADGTPLILSIAAQDGQLPGAPYSSTNGHLLVLAGFDTEGDCYVDDPAASDRAKGEVVYKKSDLEKVWLARGGTAYVLLPKP